MKWIKSQWLCRKDRRNNHKDNRRSPEKGDEAGLSQTS